MVAVMDWVKWDQKWLTTWRVIGYWYFRAKCLDRQSWKQKPLYGIELRY